MCQRGWTSRCVKSLLFGSPLLDGSQAEYVRVPYADSTLFHVPDDVRDEHIVLMADILPTGYFAADNAWKMLNEPERRGAIACVLGCGPVGLCAITAATQRFERVFAVDSVPDRLVEARKHGAHTINLNEEPLKVLQSFTEGRGADAVLELVGSPEAVVLAANLARVGGVIASCGVHNHDVTLKGSQLYNKNLRFQFGRCPVRAPFPEALELLRKVNLEASLLDGFIQKKAKLSEAPEMYKLFNDRKVLKVVFVID